MRKKNYKIIVKKIFEDSENTSKKLRLGGLPI